MFQFIVIPFNFLLYHPLFNGLVFIYNYLPTHDFGLAIIVLTIVIRLILYPISVKAFKSQRAIQKLQPQIQEMQHKYKDDKERQAKETLELYRKENINPFSGLLLALIQLPILIALYQVFWQGLKPNQLANLYSFVANPGQINPMFFAMVDLSKANILFAVAAGILQFFQTKMLMPQQKGPTAAGQKAKGLDMASMMQKQMLYFFPFLTVIILFRLPSALGLYWMVSAAFSIIQQYFIVKQVDKI